MLVQAIAGGDTGIVSRLLAASPELATAALTNGATRRSPKPYYTGDTALHVAAAAYQTDVVQKLIALGADIHARNRLGATPLHYAAVGLPGSPAWNPKAQVETIALLIRAGADPNAVNKNGVMPLHRAVRTRCAAAVKALIAGGADPLARNENGSTPMLLATLNTGRGGSGSPEVRAQQQEILHLLAGHNTTKPRGLQ